MKNKINFLGISTKLFLCLSIAIFFTSCEDAFKFDLPEANSKTDTVLPVSDFSYIPDAADFTTIYFSDLSFESTKYLWDFGGGNTSTDRDPTFTFTAGEGTYPVTLTVSDDNGASDAVTIDVVVVDVFVAIEPEILNGDFSDGQNDWKFSTFTGGTTSPYNSSSDGSNLNYDGSDNGSKTGGAKWTMSTSAGAYVSANTRYGYQAIVVSPNTDYVLEFEYAIKDDDDHAPDGNRIVGEIIDGHFDDGADAIASNDAIGPLVRHVGLNNLGKGVFTTVEVEFTSNSTGEIAILLYGVTNVDAYADNVKVYPAD